MTLLPINLPQGSKPKVKVGDKVKAGDILAENKSSSQNEFIIKLTADFGISPRKVKSSLKKNLGDLVKEGEVIAAKTEMLGITSVDVISQFSGTLHKIDEETGEVFLKTLGESKSEQVVSPVEGEIDFCNNDKIVIKTKSQARVALDGLGPEAQGEILYIEKFDPDRLSHKVSGKIFLTEKLDKTSLFKIIGLDASGVIMRELIDTDFIELGEKKMQAPVLIVSEDDFNALGKLNGQKIIINGENKSIAVL